MTYARARLWLGISTVGFWVVLAVSALVWRLPMHFLPTQPGRISSDLPALFAVFGLYALLSLPADLWGGFVLPHRHGRSSQRLGSYLASWSRGAAVQLILLTSISLIILAAARTLGAVGALAVVVLLGAVLLGTQASLSRWVSGMDRLEVGEGKLQAQLEQWKIDPARCELWENRDPGFTGGIVGLPGRERLVLPASWLSGMGSAPAAAHLVRRREALHSGARARGVAVALAWNWTGFALAILLPGADLVSVAGLVTVALGSTLWSFLGLLLLPSLSRPAVFLIDRRARALGVPDEALVPALALFDQMQDDEPRRARWIERIFHPLPSLENRRERLRHPGGNGGAWNAARLALFLSWGTLGFLSRAVHCNAGRPELWVLLPAD